MSATNWYRSVKSESAEDTQAFARKLAGLCVLGDCIALSGELGAGKTTFARGFVQALCPSESEVVSPTFTLVQTYKNTAGNPPVWHLDLYRLTSPDELEAIGLEEALASGITLIEWPELARAKLPDRTLHIDIGYGSDSNSRDMVLTSGDAGWGLRLGGMGL